MMSGQLDDRILYVSIDISIVSALISDTIQRNSKISQEGAFFNTEALPGMAFLEFLLARKMLMICTEI